jgi:hypothetical protein
VINRRQWLYGMGLVAGSGMKVGATAGVTAGNEAHAAPLELSQYEPTSMLRVHESRVDRSRFPRIDFHTHISGFQLASAASAPDQMVWAWRAAQKLPGFDPKQWQERIETALAQAKSRSDTSSYTSGWDYTAGALAGALGSQQEADHRFQNALLLPDLMLSYHFTRTARAEARPQFPAIGEKQSMDPTQPSSCSEA